MHKILKSIHQVFDARIIGSLGICSAGVLFAGCARQEPQTVVVQNEPTPIVIEKTKIKPVPQNKTVIVKPAPQPAVKTNNKVNVTVETAPTPIAIPTPVPTPKAMRPRIVATPKSTPTPRPKPNAIPRVAVKPLPRATAVPTPRPKPRPVNASANAPIVVRAEIIAASVVPDPKSVAYRDSVVFYKYKVLSVQSGKYDQPEIFAGHWGMRAKKLQPAARYRVGQVQTLTLEPFSKHPELESVQRNDDIGEFALEPYWTKSVS